MGLSLYIYIPQHLHLCDCLCETPIVVNVTTKNGQNEK